MTRVFFKQFLSFEKKKTIQKKEENSPETNMASEEESEPNLTLVISFSSSLTSVIILYFYNSVVEGIQQVTFRKRISPREFQTLPKH